MKIFSNRRRFLLAGSAAFAASIARPSFALNPETGYLDSIGLQVYTVRNQLSENEDATLKAIADAGYKQVELGSIDNGGIRLAAKARELGMNVSSSFCDFKTFTTDGGEGVMSIDNLLRSANAMKLKHVVFGYVPKGSRETVQQYEAMAERCNAAAPKFRDAGVQLCYHNHSFEFAPLDGGEKTGFDCFVEMFEPTMMFELDVFWVKIGGYDPIAMLRKLDGRVSQVHLKDLKAGSVTQWDEGQIPQDAFQELGDGVIDMQEVMRVAKEIGVSQCHVEQDQSPAPLDSIVQSINYLQQHALISK